MNETETPPTEASDPTEPEAAPAAVRPRRTVRSYVLRAGRMTDGQERALRQNWPQYGLDPQLGLLQMAQVFGRDAPVTLEIGFGDGEHLLERAAAAPERNFIGMEVHRPGIGHLMMRLTRARITNVRVFARNALDVLAQQIPPASLDEVQLLFPDPWPKARHHKRRIVQAPFASLVAQALRPGGLLHIATDWVPYAQSMLEVLEACPQLANTHGGFADGYLKRSTTRFERRGLRLGHEVRELLYRRREDVP